VENDPLERLRLFPGSVAEQVIALTDLWKSRSKRSFVAIRERMNELEDLHLELEPAAFDNYFRRSNRAKTPEDVVWALIRVMRDDAWLPQAQQCTLAEALYLAALKNVSVVTYARIYLLFPGQEAEFNALCPLGGLIAEQAQHIQSGGVGSPRLRRSPLKDQATRYLVLALLAVLLIWTALSSVGMAAP
jgi:hypothetical protein